jgi:hypothetical protein
MSKEIVVLYSNDSQECERMESFLLSLGEQVLSYSLGEDFTQSQFEEEFGSDATYPQISVGPKHIGSMKATLSTMKNSGAF